MQRKLLTNGNVFKRTDGRWGGVVWYMGEQGERKRKSFSGTTKQEANKKITNYIAEFEKAIEDTDESKKLLKDSLQNYSLQAKLIELTKSSDAKMMMQQTELLETDATVCEIDAHFRQIDLSLKTIRR